MSFADDDLPQLLAGIAQKIRVGYVFPDMAETVARHVESAAASGRYDKQSADAFCEQLTAELRQWSDDAHFRVRYSAERYRPLAGDDIVREQSDRRAHFERIGFGIASVEILPDNVGYIVIHEFVELTLSAKVITAAMTKISGCAALILDLRACVGGDPEAVAWLASYLFDKPMQLSTFEPRNAASEPFWTEAQVPGERFGSTKPVLVLTANFTFSGAEHFAYDLQALKRITVVGERTGGGAHACNFHWINEHFNLLLPECRPVNPVTGCNWEKTGISPDLPCASDTALTAAQSLAATLATSTIHEC
jgi:C-terminal processing protease CtpA/Prc